MRSVELTIAAGFKKRGGDVKRLFAATALCAAIGCAALSVPVGVTQADTFVINRLQANGSQATGDILCQPGSIQCHVQQIQGYATPIYIGALTPGVDPTGTTDSSAAIAAALTAASKSGSPRRVILTKGTYLFTSPGIVVQRSDLVFEMEKGAVVKAGSALKNSIFRFFDCDPATSASTCTNSRAPAHEHQLTLINYTCDVSGGVPVVPGRQSNGCGSFNGQLEVVAYDPYLYGGTNYTNPTGGNGFDTVSVRQTVVYSPYVYGFETAFYPNDNNVRGTANPFTLDGKETFAVYGGLIQHVGTFISAKRQLDQVIASGFLAMDCRYGIGTYWVEPASQAAAKTQGFEPPARRLLVDGTFKRIVGYAITAHAHTSGKVNVHIEDFGKDENGVPWGAGIPMISIEGGANINLDHSIIGLKDYNKSDLHAGNVGVQILNETERTDSSGLGITSPTISRSTTSPGDAGGGITGSPVISGVDFGIYEHGATLPSQIMGAVIDGSSRDVSVTNPLTVIDYVKPSTGQTFHTLGGLQRGNIGVLASQALSGICPSPVATGSACNGTFPASGDSPNPIAGAQAGDNVVITPITSNLLATPGVRCDGRVSSAGTVQVFCKNISGASYDFSSDVISIAVTR